MEIFIKKYKLELAGIGVGAIVGWCYWYFVGCASGHCIITSRPLNSTVYGSIMGGLVFSMFKKNNKKVI
ncbi:MAG: DUF6132 family protein [Bacteroidota bacterium]